MPGRRARLVPLVLATTATQASIVVLVPILVEVAREFGTSVSAAGQARTVLALTAVAAALAVGPAIDRLGVRPVIVGGGAIAVAGAAGAAAAPSLLAFHAAHVVVGVGVACLLSAGFAGVPAYFGDRDAPWAIGYVVAAQSVAWIVGNPLVGALAEAASWRASYLVPGGFAALAVAAGLAAPRAPHRERAPGGGLGAVLRDRSARRWTIAELVSYSAWTAELTYAGAFYVHAYGVGETAVGLLLAAGSLAFVVATLSTARLTRRFGRRRVIVGGALFMGTMLIPVLNVTPSVWFTLGLFWLMALGAGVRSTASSALGLAQLPNAAGSMMAARTASAQLGYAVGAAAGGAVLAASSFGTLGFVLFGVMALSALLVARVRDPARHAPAPALPAAVPD